MFGWFRKYIRKIGIFGVEVEFHPPTDTATDKPVPAYPGFPKVATVEKRVQLSGKHAENLPIAGGSNEKVIPDTAAHLAPNFSRWPKTPGVMNGASNNQIRLLRVPETTDTDWALLDTLRFWLVTRGTNTHTFGYIRSELPAQFKDPFVRWIAAAKGSGTGSEVRYTSVGEVMRVNVEANSIEILDGIAGGILV